MTKEELEGYLAEGLSLEQIGKRVDRHPSTISYHLKKHGLKPVNQQRHLRRGPIPEDRLRGLHERGASLAEIAEELDRGVATVRYWIDKYGLGPTAGGLRRGAAERARLNGDREVEFECRTHGTTPHVIENGGRVRCKRVEFHHLDRSTKLFALSREGVARSLAEARAEARKCVLLCSNCHAEVEAGYTRLPNRPSSSPGRIRTATT